MKRISDCYDVASPAGKQHILTSEMSNRESLNESLIMEHDQISADYDFVTKSLLELKRSSRNENTTTSHIITSTVNTSKSLLRFMEEYGNFPLPDWMTSAVIRDVATALLQLHTSQMTHGAVTAENVFFMRDDASFCLLTSRAHVRKIDPHRILESRGEDISQLGQIMFRCLTGREPNVCDVSLENSPFLISESGLILSSKMMARKFGESVHFIISHPFITSNTRKCTARFLNLN